jgi:hypothetical protein
MTPPIIGIIYRAVFTAFAVYASAEHADIRAPMPRSVDYVSGDSARGKEK